jgi:hypothetical protein
MTLELTLRSPFTLPRILRAHADEPEQDFHWIGKTQETTHKDADSGGKGGGPQKKRGKKEYRSLSALDKHEVDEILHVFEPQLVRSPLDGWIARNHFCQVHLKRRGAKSSPVVFGRVRSCYPAEGHADNVQEFDLLFPNKGAEPDMFQIQAGMINFLAAQPVETYCLGVRFLFSADEKAEFRNQEGLFLAEGFQPDVRDNYLELLEMNERNHSRPWLYVIGSRWLTSIPDFRYDVILGRFREMLGWGSRIVNYHPDWLPKEVHSLNRELGLKYKLSKDYLTEPETPQDTAQMLKIEFGEMFDKGLLG